MPDPFDLKRFVDAQHGTYDQALQELAAGHKRRYPGPTRADLNCRRIPQTAYRKP